jgi:hypothetical protein
MMSAAYELARPVVMPSELDDLAKHGFSNEDLQDCCPEANACAAESCE